MENRSKCLQAINSGEFVLSTWSSLDGDASTFQDTENTTKKYANYLALK